MYFLVWIWGLEGFFGPSVEGAVATCVEVGIREETFFRKVLDEGKSLL